MYPHPQPFKCVASLTLAFYVTLQNLKAVAGFISQACPFLVGFLLERTEWDILLLVVRFLGGAEGEFLGALAMIWNLGHPHTHTLCQLLFGSWWELSGRLSRRVPKVWAMLPARGYPSISCRDSSQKRGCWPPRLFCLP